MLKVECPSCDAPYELDPARLPDAGMRMRCPACAAIFRVGPQGIMGDAAAPAAPTPSAGPLKTQVAMPGQIADSGPKAAAPPPPRVAPAAPPRVKGPNPAAPPRPGSSPLAGGPPPPQPPKPPAAMPKAPPAPPKPPAARGGATAIFGADDLDLPAPSKRETSEKDSLLGFEVPTTESGARREPQDSLEMNLPSPDSPEIGGEFDLGFGDLDLPAPSKRPAPRDSLDGFDIAPPLSTGQLGAIDDSLDLPVPSAKRDESDFSDLDLELPQVKRSDSLDDLAPPPPTPWASGAGSLDDLPIPKDVGRPEHSLDDLPSPSRGRSALPTAAETFDLPIPAGMLGETGGERPSEASLEEALGKDAALDEPVVAEPSGGASTYGEIDLGAAAYGEANLDTEGLEGGEASLEGLDFDGDLELEDIAGAQTPTSVPVEVEPPRASRGPLIVFLVLVMLAGAGAALGFTPHGIFGRYYLEQFLPDAGSEAEALAVFESAERRAADDRYESIRASLKELASARREQGLNRLLLTRSIVHEVLFQRRFGESAASRERIARIMSRLEERKFVAPQMELAKAADALSRGDRDAAESALELAREEAPDDPYVDLIAAELALQRGALGPALVAFERAERKSAGARASYGKARILFASASGVSPDADADGVIDTALEALGKVLERSPRHVSARVDKATLHAIRGERDEARTLAREAANLETFEGELLGGSTHERARAFAILGFIEERSGARREALEAFERSYALDPSNSMPVYGSALVLLRDNRAKDALIRFETAARSAKPHELYGIRPIALEAQLGAVSAELSLGEIEDARDRAAALVQHYPEDPRVLLRAGEAMASAGSHLEAERFFRDAIEKSPETFHAYMGLAQLLFETDRAEQAAEVLREAEGKVEMTAEVRRLRGQAELKRLRPAEALDEFDRAIALDANDLDAVFGRAMALRMLGRLDEAEGVFSQLSERDPSNPGLAIERGRLFEAKGLTERAVEAYREALKERGEDPELLLRAGAAELLSGSLEDAERHLLRASEALPNHPELIHQLGRVAMRKGDMTDALDKLSRAVAMERENGLFRTEYARALIAAGDLAGARREIVEALASDPSLADAYWLRGRIALRTGSPRDAIDDLEKALRLRPGRHEALSDLGEAFEQLNRTSYAISAFERAVQLAPDEGRYAYRLGRLYIDNNQLRLAERSLARAIEVAEAKEDAPTWLSDAHRLLGDTYRALRNRRSAKEAYERFLELAPADSIDRTEVERRVREL